MKPLSRRTFVKTAVIAGAAFSARSWAQVAGANGDVRVAVAGLNGRGKEIAAAFRKIAGVRLVALCDVDTAVLDRELATARAAGEAPDPVVDFRDLLTRADIDAIAIATPNHWHALQGIWAMQAGKDVLHEKPVSHNLWEGAQLLAAERQTGRIVQVNTQNRSSVAIAEALAWTNARSLGKITTVRGVVYKRRLSIGQCGGPVTPPATVNYDLFLGPAPLVPLHRLHFHYDWHWQWATGNGDIVAQGNHQLDVGRRFLGDPGHPARVMTVGGRLGYEDDGETPNSFIVHYDYPVPFIFEVRGLPTKPDQYSGNVAGEGGLGAAGRLAATMDRYRGLSVGNIIHCEGGHLAIPSGDYGLVQAYDTGGRLVKEFHGAGNHTANFIEAVRSRKPSDLHGPLRQGFLSSSLAHLANISHRTGTNLNPGDIRDQIAGDRLLAEADERLMANLAANSIDLKKSRLALGAPLAFDGATEHFTGNNAAAANAHLSRDYRKPFVVPRLA